MRRRLFPLKFLATLCVWLAVFGVAQARPRYELGLKLDYQLLTFTANGKITVPVAPGEALNDAVFFIYANAPGVTGNDGAHKNIAIDEVTLNGAPLDYSLDGAVLRVKFPQPQSAPVVLDMKWRGVVPRARAGSGGLIEAMGGMDLGSLFGGAAGQTKKEPDYGVYSQGNGVLSLGSFWYPSLAVRQNGKWIDEAPGGVGDVGFSEVGDFSVRFTPSFPLVVATTGEAEARGDGTAFSATGVRDFALLASADFISKSQRIDVGGKSILVSAYVTKAHQEKVDTALDIAVNALQIFNKRFGPYPYTEFKVVEGPMRGGAGGMEFSGLVSIAAFLFEDMDKQMQQLTASLGLGNIDQMMGQLFPEQAEENGAANPPANPAADMLGGLLGGQKAIMDSLLETTIAHEVAHQWWAMGVGSDAQRAPWVDESLTNYSAMIYFEDRYGKARADEMMELHLKGAYSTGRMLGGPDAPVNQGTGAYMSNIQYGAIVYGKGALFYDALRKLVGDEVFFTSLREYYAKYNGKIAPARGLLDTIKAKSGNKAGDVETLYLRWIEGTHGDQDIAGGPVGGVESLLGGLLGGMAGGLDQ